ncbi:hypothetical protein RHS04_08096 [Rhizoctonia solani]|uniref:Uncharacterized protein n=1 Tax=Rhizoctonia solani TaxID=456999 RepID=A0A8H7H2S6_9AGAM|nr:hypothetical protein RHS04_08096 [Rhizoctonia solani]
MQVWKYNTKDLIMSQNQSYGQPPTLSFAGRRRSENIRTASELHAPGNILRRFLANVLFRRVSPAETRTYAITRNAFSIISLGALMFRVVTALQKAQNELGTRIVSDNCDKSIPSDRIDVISDVVNFPLRRPQVQITVNGTRAQGSGVCTPQGNLSILFTCEPNGQRLPGPTENNYYRPTFYFEVLSTGGALNEADMPSFWLINRGERFSSAEASVIANDPSVGLAAWLYTPSWQLRPGFHIEAEAQSVTRRFLTSSIIRDILLSSEPTYARTNLFPIVEVGAFVLPNNTLATAALRVSRKPGYAYMRDWKAFSRIDTEHLTDRYRDLCTYIDDYRESTVLDAIGSIGGLFALLQAAHILLFGRPMLWSLTGAKLITPFGLFGVCSSKGFKRRLRQQYYQYDTSNNSDAFLVGDFLRDFVIDLGPAGSNDKLPIRDTLIERSPSVFPSDKMSNTYTQVSLMPLEVRQTPSFENSLDINELATGARERLESTV